MPSDSSFFVALGPIPLILRTDSGQIRSGMSDISRIVRPSGFPRSEHILDNSLFGVIPMEQESPVASCTACLIRFASTKVLSGRSLRSMYISSMPVPSILGAIPATAALNSRE